MVKDGNQGGGGGGVEKKRKKKETKSIANLFFCFN